KEAGLTKSDIRALSTQLGLPTADKPQMACLSSRIPYGEAVTVEKLQMIEQAENVLRDLGFYELRVRHHELPMRSTPSRPDPELIPGSSLSQAPLVGSGALARIEVGIDEVPRLLEEKTREAVASRLKEIGYAHVTVDLEGYRRGSLNQNQNHGLA